MDRHVASLLAMTNLEGFIVPSAERPGVHSGSCHDAGGIALFAEGGDAALQSMTVHELAPRGRAMPLPPDRHRASESGRSKQCSRLWSHPLIVNHPAENFDPSPPRVGEVHVARPYNPSMNPLPPL